MPRTPELAEEIQQRHWFHTIDLGDGLVTKGDSPPSKVIAEAMPDVKGKSVLDIGAWDGKYSYEAEMAGAARVVALDHYVWRLDAHAREEYYKKCVREGVLPDPDLIDRGFLTDGLPGRAGFDLLHRFLDSNVEAVVDDFATMDVTTLGQFDVVFYFGVLYHMVNPIGSLKRLRQVTKGVAVIETAAIEVLAFPNDPLVEFYADDALSGDYGNWFAPTSRALIGMCRSAGFRQVEVKATSAPAGRAWHRGGRRNAPGISRCRISAQAYP